MIRIALAAATAAILFAAVPASAQTGAMGSDSMSSTPAMSCADMMTKAQTMRTPEDTTKALDAQKEMKMAETAQASKDETTCKMHMKKAMDDLM